MTDIPDAIRHLIVDKVNQGESQRKVSLQLNVCLSTVNEIVKRYRSTGSTDNRCRSGRPKKTTERERRFLCQLSKKEPFMSPRQLLRDAELANQISLRSARRILSASGLVGRIAARKPLLNKKHIRQRNSFCKDYLQMTASAWGNVIFTDEMRIELYGSRRAYVRRKVGMRFHNEYVCKTVKFGGRSLLLWGAIKEDGSRILLRCPKIMNSAAYQSVLNEGLPDIYSRHSVLMHDGAPCHRSMSTKLYLERKKICYISDWPSQSPDLNIIENMWAVLKRNVSQRFPHTIEELWEVAKKEWYAIDNAYIRKLYASIPRRLNAVRKMHGKQSKY